MFEKQKQVQDLVDGMEYKHAQEVLQLRKRVMDLTKQKDKEKY